VKERTTEAALEEAIEIIEDCWNQFAYPRGPEGRQVLTSGGLSTLEWIEEALPRLRAIYLESV